MPERAELWRKTRQRGFWLPATRGSKKDWYVHNSCGWGSPCLGTLGATRVPTTQAAVLASHSTLTGAELPQANKKSCVYARRVALVVSSSLWPWWTVACQASVRGFSRQEYWSVLANSGWHIFLEHCISCCLSCQHPWVPGAARTPASPAAAPPLHLAHSGADPSPPGQPQEQTPMDDPQAEVEIKPQLKPRGSVAKEEDPKPSHQLYNLQVKSTWSIRQTLCLQNT